MVDGRVPHDGTGLRRGGPGHNEIGEIERGGGVRYTIKDGKEEGTISERGGA